MTEDSKLDFPRVNLNVPYAQKNVVSALGARWDKTNKVWYVPAGKDSAPFASWIDKGPKTFEPSVKADYFFLAKVPNRCWKCDKESDAFALFLPEGFMESDYEDEDDETNENMAWYEGAGVGVLSFVEAVNPDVAKVLSEHAPGYTRDFSKTTQSHYLMNHCAHCKASQGDFFLHEIGQGFFPTDIQGCERVTLKPFPIEIQAEAGTAWSTIDYASMRYEPGPGGFEARLESEQ